METTLTPSPERIAFATEIFLRECGRQWLKQHPAADPATSPLKAISAYPPRQRIALQVALTASHLAMTGMDEAFAAFQARKTDENGK